MTDHPEQHGHDGDPSPTHTGAWPPQSWPTAPAYSAPPRTPRHPVGFGTAIANGFKRSFSSEGRATRSEFWYFFLLYAAVFACVGALGTDWAYLLGTIVFLSLLVPFIAVGVRRLHDTGRSGGWCWMLLSAIGFVVLLILWSEPSQPDANQIRPLTGGPVAQQDRTREAKRRLNAKPIVPKPSFRKGFAMSLWTTRPAVGQALDTVGGIGQPRTVRPTFWNSLRSE